MIEQHPRKRSFTRCLRVNDQIDTQMSGDEVPAKGHPGRICLVCLQSVLCVMTVVYIMVTMSYQKSDVWERLVLFLVSVLAALDSIMVCVSNKRPQSDRRCMLGQVPVILALGCCVVAHCVIAMLWKYGTKVNIYRVVIEVLFFGVALVGIICFGRHIREIPQEDPGFNRTEVRGLFPLSSVSSFDVEVEVDGNVGWASPTELTYPETKEADDEWGDSKNTPVGAAIPFPEHVFEPTEMISDDFVEIV